MRTDELDGIAAALDTTILSTSVLADGDLEVAEGCPAAVVAEQAAGQIRRGVSQGVPG